MVYRIYVEKKQGLTAEADVFLSEDAESFLFPVFSEPQQNSIFSSFPLSAANQKISKYIIA